MVSIHAATTNIYAIAARLWETADELRANSHLPPQGGGVLDPGPRPIFLKFADSRFSMLEGELKGKSTRHREVGKPDYQARGVLYLPEPARLNQLVRLKESDNLGKRSMTRWAPSRRITHSSRVSCRAPIRS